MNTEELLLPPSARVVHVGPHKTGTTSVQSAFHTHRAQVEQHGVHYAGKGRQPVVAALAVAGGPGGKGDRTPRPEDWTRLLEEIRAAGDQRVVVSSEYFCHADDAAARRVVTEIPGGPVHVVVTLRPLTKIAPSQWQQFTQNGRHMSFEDWIADVFPDPPSTDGAQLFWHRHAHGELVARWADAVGPENLTVIVADGSAPDRLVRTFESLVGLPVGLLDPEENSANRSLSRGEVELVRAVNQSFADHDWTGHWTNAEYDKFVFRGAVLQMKTGRRPAKNEPRVEMPAWAAERARRAGAAAAETIASLGVRVIGDLSTLHEPPRPGPATDDDADAPYRVPADAAALAVLGAMTAPAKATDAARTAAMLSMLVQAGLPERSEDERGIPMVSTDAAARAVLGVIEGRNRGVGMDDVRGLPAPLGGLAVIAASRAAGAPERVDFGGARSLKEPLAVGRPPAKRRPTARRVPVSSSAKRTVDETAARDLLRVVAGRGVRRLRARRRRGRR